MSALRRPGGKAAAEAEAFAAAQQEQIRQANEAQAAAEAHAVQQRAAAAFQAIHDQIAWCWRELARLALTPGFESRMITVTGGKGGSNKTTVAAMLGHYFSQVVRMLTVVVDLNPNVATLVNRFVADPSTDVGSLPALVKSLDKVHYPTQLDAYLQPAPGRVHILHNTFAELFDINNIGRPQLDGVRARLGKLAQLVIADTGNSMTDQFFGTAMAGADHVVFGLLGEEDALRAAREARDRLSGLGYAGQIGRPVTADGPASVATAVIGIRQPDLDPALLRPAVAWWSTQCGGTPENPAAFLVPYDPALAGGGLIDWEALAPQTDLAFLKACVHVARVFTRPAAAAPAAYTGRAVL